MIALKHRIKEETWSDGTVRYIPQHKVLWWWNDYKEEIGYEYYVTFKYNTLKEAQDFLQQEGAKGPIIVNHKFIYTIRD